MNHDDFQRYLLDELSRTTAPAKMSRRDFVMKRSVWAAVWPRRWACSVGRISEAEIAVAQAAPRFASRARIRSLFPGRPDIRGADVEFPTPTARRCWATWPCVRSWHVSASW